MWPASFNIGNFDPEHEDVKHEEMEHGKMAPGSLDDKASQHNNNELHIDKLIALHNSEPALHNGELALVLLSVSDQLALK